VGSILLLPFSSSTGNPAPLHEIGQHILPGTPHSEPIHGTMYSPDVATYVEVPLAAVVVEGKLPWPTPFDQRTDVPDEGGARKLATPLRSGIVKEVLLPIQLCTKIEFVLMDPLGFQKRIAERRIFDFPVNPV